MVGKNRLKFIKSLQQKKYRNLNGRFVVEGVKGVREFLDSPFAVEAVYSTDSEIFSDLFPDTVAVSSRELAQMSGLKNPAQGLAVLEMPASREVDFSDWVVALDNVRDPGNLGTIIRLCDWFGIQHLFCSEGSVDCYNPKVLQATMGSFTRVNVVYGDLVRFLEGAPVSLFGTFMDGKPLQQVEWPKKGVLVMGNEANGVSPEIAELIGERVGIPAAGTGKTESLNVATATAISLYELRR